MWVGVWVHVVLAVSCIEPGGVVCSDNRVLSVCRRDVILVMIAVLMCGSCVGCVPAAGAVALPAAMKQAGAGQSVSFFDQGSRKDMTRPLDPRSTVTGVGYGE